MQSRAAEIGATIGRIRDPSAYERGQWDLDIFSGCFGDTKIAASDRDGAVERRGCVLLFEFKSPKERMPLAQDLLYRALAGHRKIHVMAIRGQRNDPEEYCFWKSTGEGGWRACDLNGARLVVSNWYKWADNSCVKNDRSKSTCGCLIPGDAGYLDAIPAFDADMSPTWAGGAIRCDRHAAEKPA